MKTKVKFYVEPGAGRDVLAVFVPEGGVHRDMYECYSHMGQHSTCSEDYLKSLRPANPSERLRLERELKSIGYRLEVVG